MDFPHLNDTKFPIIDNVNVYKYQNNFDYERWQGKVSIKLINVLWNSTYADVPYFNNENERDKWFDSQEGYVHTLETLFNNTPRNTIRVPIPYNDAYKYNYVVVEMPMQTSATNPINYEDNSIRIKRWYYFIEDMTQYAPSTTEIEIELDYWTTFINSVDIPYLMLERGHAPMKQTTVEQYLANPIMNNEYLLADDFNYGNDTTIIQTTNYVPMGNGKKYVLFVAPLSVDAFPYLGGVAWDGNATPPSYSNTDERWGYQIKVNDYEWKYGRVDYSNAQLPISNQIQTGILNGLQCFAIEGIYAKDFFNDMAINHVNLIHAIKAVFMLDENLFWKEEPFEFEGYTIYIANRQRNTLDFNFNKAQFGYDDKYADITKLYTSPYSVLEISDNEGNVFSANIENCGNVQMISEVSLMYPFLNYNILFAGINGDSSVPYQWETVYGSVHNRELWASDFAKYMMNWEIPTYTLYVSAEYEYAVNNAFANQAKRAGAIKDYQNAVRYANTTKENVDDSFQTQTDNIAASGSTNEGNTKRTTQANVDNTATLMTAVHDNNELACDNNYALRGLSITQNLAAYTANEIKINNDTSVANGLTLTTVSTKNDYASISYRNSSGANFVNSNIGMVGSTVAGGLAGGPGGAAAGFVSGLTNVAQNSANIMFEGATVAASISTDSAIAAATAQANNNYAANSNKLNRDMSDITNSVIEQSTNMNNQCARSQVGNTVGANNTAASNTKTAEDANAKDLKDTNNANAGRTQTTETNNANETRNATIVAEKANLVQKQLEVENQYKNSRLHVPYEQGIYSGDYMNDVYMRRGVSVNIRTQNKSAIAQAGDAFLRFGYALHRVWDMSNGFHYCKNFTFWKAEDIWINDGSGVANIATKTIGDIILKGVTVWRDPSKIGTVSIYDN